MQKSTTCSRKSETTIKVEKNMFKSQIYFLDETQYELLKRTWCQEVKWDQIRMGRIPVGFISMHALNIEQQES